MVRDGVTWLIRSNGSNMGMYVQAYAFIFANFQALDKVTNRNKMPHPPPHPQRMEIYEASLVPRLLRLIEF